MNVRAEGEDLCRRGETGRRAAPDLATVTEEQRRPFLAPPSRDRENYARVFVKRFKIETRWQAKHAYPSGDTSENRSGTNRGLQ